MALLHWNMLITCPGFYSLWLQYMWKSVIKALVIWLSASSLTITKKHCQVKGLKNRARWPHSESTQYWSPPGQSSLTGKQSWLPTITAFQTLGPDKEHTAVHIHVITQWSHAFHRSDFLSGMSANRVPLGLGSNRQQMTHSVCFHVMFVRAIPIHIHEESAATRSCREYTCWWCLQKKKRHMFNINLVTFHLAARPLLLNTRHVIRPALQSLYHMLLCPLHSLTLISNLISVVCSWPGPING